MTPVGISGLISDMCPFIPSDLPEGIPYGIGVAACLHRNRCQLAGQAPGVLSVQGRGVNLSLGLLGAARLPKAPLQTTSKALCRARWWKWAQRLAGIQLSKQIF